LEVTATTAVLACVEQLWGSSLLAKCALDFLGICYYLGSFDLVCLDIMMPLLDGQAVLKEIRALETEHRVPAAKEVKVIMTTALGDKLNVVEAIVFARYPPEIWLSATIRSLERR